MTQHVESETYSETADTGTHINEATDSEAWRCVELQVRGHRLPPGSSPVSHRWCESWHTLWHSTCEHIPSVHTPHQYILIVHCVLEAILLMPR